MINHDYIRIHDQPYSNLIDDIREGAGFRRGTNYKKPALKKREKQAKYTAKVTVITRDNTYTFSLEEKDYYELVKKEQRKVDWYMKRQWKDYELFCYRFPHETKIEPELLKLEIVETDLEGNIKIV